MAGLPELTERIVTSEAPQARLSGAQIAQPYEMLAHGLDKLGEGLEDVAIPLAERAGSQAVTRDDQGNIQVEHAPIFGEAGKAYARAVKVGALAEADGAAERADIELRTQFRDDPQGYAKAADSFKRKQVENMTAAAGPEVGVALGRAIETTTTRTYRGLLNEKESLDLQRANGAITAGITSASNDAVALARQGVPLDSPDMQSILSKYGTLLDEKTNNPRLAYSKEQRDLDFQSFQGEIAGARNLYHVDQVYKTQGYAAAVDAAKDVLTNEDYKLDPAQRQAFYSHAMGEIRANEAVRHQDIGEARIAFGELKAASQLGQKIEPTEVDSLMNAFDAAGYPAGRAQVRLAFSHLPLNDDFGRQPIPEQTQFLNALNAAKPYAPMIMDEAQKHGLDPDTFARQLYKENQFKASGVSPAGARGIAQFMPATAERYGVNPDDPKSAIPGAANYMGDLKRMFMGNTGLALAGYNWGEGNVQKWLSSGADPARVPQETRNYVKDITGQSIDAWAKGQQKSAIEGASFLSGPGMASWLLANRSATLNDTATQAWKGIMDDFAAGKGGFPSQARINEVIDAANATGNVDLLARIGREADIIDKVQRISQYPVAQQTAIETEYRRQLNAGTAGAGAEFIEKQLVARTQAIQKGLEENPVSTAIANFPDKLKTPGPLNLQDPQQLIAGLKMRGQIAQIAAANWQTGPLSALDAQDVAQVKAALSNPDPAAKAGIFGAISTLPKDVLGATLRKIGGNEPEGMAQAAAGSLMAKDPAISASIFRGQAALKADDRL